MPERTSAATLSSSWPCGQELRPAGRPISDHRRRLCYEVLQLLVAQTLDRRRHEFSHPSHENEEVSSLLGHTPPNHYVCRVMAFCILIMHLKGRLSTNLVVLFVKLLLDGEHFLASEEDVFVSVLSVPLEETLCSFPSDILQMRSKKVSL